MAEVVTAAVGTVAGIATNVIKTTAAVTKLGQLPGLVNLVPFTVLLWGHCLAVAGFTRGRYSGQQLLSFVQGFLMAFGGGIASNLFLGNPTSNVLFQGNQAVLIWTASWWIVNHQPLDIVSKALDLAPVGIVARACLQVLRAGLLVAQVDAAAKAFPGVIAPAIIAGALAASGGKISTDIIASFAGLRAPFEVSNPTYVLRSSIVGSSVYYVTVYVLKALTPTEGLAVVLLAFLSHTLSDDLLGSAYDYTVPIINVFNTVTLITPPAKRAARTTAARGRAPAATAAPSTPRSASKARTPSRRRRSD
jgi:TRIC channel